MLPEVKGPCTQLALIRNKDLQHSQRLFRETESGLLDCMARDRVAWTLRTSAPSSALGHHCTDCMLCGNVGNCCPTHHTEG